MPQGRPRSAGDVGEEAISGPASVYWFGASDPTLLLEGQWEICKSRFESLFGEHLDASPPLRVLVFGKRSHFDAFFRAAFLYSSNLDGIYVPWSTATISITTEFPDFRLADPARSCESSSLTSIWTPTGNARRRCGSRSGLPMSWRPAGTKRIVPGSIARCSQPFPEETRLVLRNSFTGTRITPPGWREIGGISTTSAGIAS